MVQHSDTNDLRDGWDTALMIDGRSELPALEVTYRYTVLELNAVCSYHSTHLTSSNLASTDLISSQLTAPRSVAATANWVVRCV